MWPVLFSNGEMGKPTVFIMVLWGRFGDLHSFPLSLSEQLSPALKTHPSQYAYSLVPGCHLDLVYFTLGTGLTLAMFHLRFEIN